jgi:hypothetical protein
MTRIRIITALVGAAAALTACSGDGIQKIAGPTAGSFVKFYNFAVNAPSVNFFANDAKVTAVSATSCTPPSTPPNPACASAGIESPNGTAYGALGNGGLYASIPPAQYLLSGRISDTITNRGLQIAKLTTTLADGKYYSFYTSGFYDANAKTTDAFIIEDVFPATIDFTTTSVRFVNASSNSNPMTLYIKSTVTGDSAVIGSSIAYKNAGPFLSGSGGVYDLTVRYAGSNTAVITRTGVSFSNVRIYTVTARGDMTVTSTTAATRPTLDVTANR